MKTKSSPDKIRSKSTLSRLRLAVAGTLFLGAAGLAAHSLQLPRLRWAVPTVAVSDQPYSAVTGVAVDADTNTIYVASLVAGDQVTDSTIAVIDGSRCDARNASHCVALARMTNVGPAPFWLTFDPATSTLYVTNGLTPDYDDNNTVTVLDTRTCNARNTSGCNQMPAATVTVPGPLFNLGTGAVPMMALDATTHTLYVGDANDGPVSMINTATCNATNTSGCNQTPTTMANGDAITLDRSTHTLYVTDSNDSVISVLDGATCNSTDQSGCAQGTTFATPYGPGLSAVDPITHTLYVPMLPAEGTLGLVGLLDVSACNSTIRSGCGGAPPHLVQVGSFPFQVLIDPATRTAYVESEGSSSISVINTATCNAHNLDGCPRVAPALATGINPTINIEINPRTHSLYSQSQDSNSLWVFDTNKCNAIHTHGCTNFEPTTTVGIAPVGVAGNPNTRTAYVANQADNTISVINMSECNREHSQGCNQNWPTVAIGNTPRFVGINKLTNTIYVSNHDDNTLSVINGATCNSQATSGCMQPQPTTTVGNGPQQIVVDEARNTIYVVNQSDDTVSVINGAHCNGADTSGCSQSWPAVAVGDSPQALGLNPTNHTIYVANTSDNTVSVINGNICNGTITTGCGQTPATVAVGAAPRAIGIVAATNTVFVGNSVELTVSVIDGSTCSSLTTSGCGQVPPAIAVGAFPDTAGNGNNILARRIAVDSARRTVYIPTVGDSDVVTLDANACRAGHMHDCHARIVPGRMGGSPIDLAVDESSGTVYVTNIADGTVSLFPSSH